jgi:curved DNA-binding protein CbpA
MPSVDFYKILQVDHEAHPDVVRAAYRVLARVYHPDIQGGSVEMMVALNNAWAVISDEAKRAEYDRSRNPAASSELPEPIFAHSSVVATRPSGPTAPPRSRARNAPASNSTVLNFGRYEGWTLQQIAGQDADFLEWLSRMPIGRPYRDEIESLLAASHRPTAPTSGKGRRGDGGGPWKGHR